MPSNAFSRISAAIQRPKAVIIGFFAGSATLRCEPTGELITTSSSQAEFTTPGTYSWVAPTGITSVCVVCVSGGEAGGLSAYQSTDPGQGFVRIAYGGRGGTLAYKNNVAVTPGTTYEVVVGAGGVGNGGNGGTSSFGGALVKAVHGNLSTSVGDAKYLGGAGGYSAGLQGAAPAGSGGGGAGGYAGAGGAGGGYDYATSAGAGTGGAGGGGARGSNGGIGGNGGGVGIYGQGSNGAGGSPAGSAAAGGPGSGGTGQSYGGGGAAGALSQAAGGGGAVRIIWGPGRAFPSTNTANI